MKETIGGATSPLDPTPIVSSAQMAATRGAIVARSMLVWAEHCSECAMPECYASCAFYTPRRDLKCQRLVDGLQETPFPDGAASLLRIRFRKWGKLEAAGVVSLAPANKAAKADRLDSTVEKIVGKAPEIMFFRHLLARQWNKRKAKLFSRWATAESAPDCFLLECELHAPDSAKLTISIKPRNPRERFFQSHVTLAPGYNRIEISVADIVKFVDLGEALLFQIEPIGNWARDELIVSVADFVQMREMAKAPPARAPAAKRKCVVWDLDNTLWKGILIEDGLEALEINPSAVSLIEEFDRRGVLHSIASKNNPEDAFAALEKFDLRDYFLAPQIGWTPKSQSLDIIAKALNLGVESFAFIDDQAFERAEVASAHPNVSIYCENEIEKMRAADEFGVPATPEAAQRRHMYRDEERRQLVLDSYGDRFAAFLKSCDIRLTIATLQAENMDRVFELSQRTNQLNYAGARLGMAEIRALLDMNPNFGLVLSCVDRFGDYGVVGFAVVNAAALTVENFFMSCRVQNKKIDNAFFFWLQRHAMARGMKKLSVRFSQTAKNGAARLALSEMRFVAEGESGYYSAPDPGEFPDADVVTILDHTQFDEERASHVS
ncbi:HAD-IIIC family phosphatase [Rhodoblastus sp.]|uniref:HAD-IIIC family phosphatase n=1 Tax=Rhodoblastus sp. TaxID=1962975 RepID=UPI003F97DE96